MAESIERREVAKVYNSATWRRRVAKMSERQVFALYIKFKHEGKIK